MIGNFDAFKELEFLKADSVDIVITDPPYDLNEKQKTFLHREFLRIAKSGVIVFSPPENQWIMPADQYGFWVKPISTKNTVKRYSRFVEMLFFYGNLKWNSGYHWSQYTNVFSDLVEDNSGHPFTKSTSLINRLIRNHTDRRDLVFDPFAGSGSILKSAYSLDRRYFGYDIDPKCIEYMRNSGLRIVKRYVKKKPKVPQRPK